MDTNTTPDTPNAPTALPRIDAEWVDKKAAWSLKTFGPGERLTGVTRHIEKELEEVRKDPRDPDEWADLIILAMDGASRQGVDCRPDFFRAVEAVWRTTLGDKAPRIYAPLLALQKPEIVAEGYRLRVDIGVTWSCYSPRVPGVPCGACDACALRRDAIRRASVPGRSLPS